MTTAALRQAPEASADETIKLVPQEAALRRAIRREASYAVAAFRQASPPSYESLEAAAEAILRRLSLSRDFLGFAMVAVDNAFWRDAFEAVPPERRLLLLPKCLSLSEGCRGTFDSVGLHCADCGGCVIPDLQAEAEALGYQVVVAEGTSSVVMKVLEGEADAVLGVACLDSLEKSFHRIADLGVPHQAVPLLADGCKDTQAELDILRAALRSTGGGQAAPMRTYLPLLRATKALFEPRALSALLAPHACVGAEPSADGPFSATDAIARDWLLRAGKRSRPFITLAAYAVGRHGWAALAPDADLGALVPDSVRCVAAAIEVLHKASLVHDDIEDRDAFRYGQPTVYKMHGPDTAINVGDYLVGLGYRLIAAQTPELGAECVADILARLSAAHLRLCCGQGAELLWNGNDGQDLRPADALQIGALKTAPAFEVALYAGLRPAGVAVEEELLRRFAAFVGEGFQVLNDLEDWDDGEGLTPGRDALAGRPTILKAFAVEAGGAEALAEALGAASDAPEQALSRVRALYEDLGAFARAEALLAGLRNRALGLAGEIGDEALQELLRFLVRSILPWRAARPRSDAT